MKKILILSAFIFLSFSLIFGSYQSDVSNAYKQYKAGHYKEALRLYEKAYKQHRTRQVYDYIVYLQNKLYKRKNTRAENYYSSDGIKWAPQERIITVNPIGLLGGDLGAHYEMTMGRSNGLGFNAGLDFHGGDWLWLGINAGTEYNWYFQNHALNGWFAGPGAGISLLLIRHKYTPAGQTASVTGSSIGLGMQLGGHGGYRWIFDNGFVVDVIAGLGFTIPISSAINGAYAPFGGIGPFLGCDLGYAF